MQLEIRRVECVYQFLNMPFCSEYFLIYSKFMHILLNILLFVSYCMRKVQYWWIIKLFYHP